ncbi:helix-turn-helix domain-containing protein [Frondihabitans sp. VKM Ac-2883]|uniref:PucR family transcriptional regulator n=1 Tax=Frondihabitans sp. VKM Ac-2883 TaxID=2783823 RepID=UPI001889E585|nr:helix-turn-helix domain-containing protein [Frondihabitans sp. VKM Ac-2883]
MEDDLQRMVDSLALTLQRSVAVDDAQLRLLRSSAHFGDEDDLRLKSLVDRRVPEPVAAHLHRLGVATWREPGHGAGTEEVAFATRWCVPLRTRYELLGFLWVIDDGTLTPPQLAEIRDGATRFEDYLGREAERRHAADRRQDAAVRQLVHGIADERRAGAERLRGEGASVTGLMQAIAVSVATVALRPEPSDPGLDLSPRAFLSRGVRAGLATRPPGSYALAIDDTEAIVLIGWSAVPTAADVETVGTRIRDALVRTEPLLSHRAVIGVGGPVPALLDARDSWRQSRLALRVASAEGEPVRSWSTLGASGYVAALLPDTLDPVALPEPFATLLGEQSAEALDLIAAYLENGGSAAVTATALNLHRSTLYLRLGRFEQATGLSLDRGADRLAVHLWLTARHYRIGAEGSAGGRE